MTEQDIRWLQRLQNYGLALSRLTFAVELADTRPLSDLEKQGLIQAFEFTYELAWNVIKDFYQYQGEEGIQGSRDAFRTAFSRGLVEHGEIWMQMIKSRQLSSHAYNIVVAETVFSDVCQLYYPQFIQLKKSLDKQAENV
ncbi:nucleotidyltransferase substrate binding protein [Paraglaciecola aquimarina]|uniref:Nucleotidyltransferase substrate binding protein n=1 Tax=Paraglaciecola algarum TaxID=3050085 RepID=A0ABS9D860_9ALTE|nr:nucleotidyltransferase substrate binding protein [Paraglaciecola sp. G1-23]MCF2949115.1 nucleotidyltransferase substrate binding protein [Paraglaciecola sp. G1-23]